jgi:hypothetical protein
MTIRVVMDCNKFKKKKRDKDDGSGVLQTHHPIHDGNMPLYPTYQFLLLEDDTNNYFHFNT